MKKPLSVLLIFLLIVTVLAGCSSPNEDDSHTETDCGKLTVIATLFPQYDFAKEIAGDKAEIILLLPPGMESHSYEPTPGDIITIHNSDIFLYTGDEMEPWVSGIVENIEEDNVSCDHEEQNCADASHNHKESDSSHHLHTPVIADLSSGIALQKDVHNHVHDGEPCTDETHNHDDDYIHCDEETHNHEEDACSDDSHDHEEDACSDDSHNHEEDACSDDSHDHEEDACSDDSHDHEEECNDETHDHEEESILSEALMTENHSHDYNPHIWTSPVLAMKMVENIVEAFVTADPENASYYETNGAAYLKKLQDLDQRFREITEHADFDTVYVGSKFSLLYFMEEYGLHYVAAYDSCEEEAEPSIKRVVSMIESMKASGVKAIYYQELIEPYIADTIAEAAGAQTYLFHSCHNVSRDDLEAGVTYLGLMEQNADNLEKGLYR